MSVGAKVRRVKLRFYSGEGGLREGCVGVWDAGFFEAEADEFAAAGDGGPVDELVGR